jgi:hypothetical protein
MTSDLAKSLSENPDKEDIIEDVPMGRYGLLIFFTAMVGIMAMIPMVKVIYPPLFKDHCYMYYDDFFRENISPSLLT